MPHINIQTAVNTGLRKATEIFVMMDEHTSNVRYHIFKFCLDHCHPPSVRELALLTGQPVDKIPEILRVLEQEKHLMLYKENVPSQTPIAMVHPFAHLYVLHVCASPIKDLITKI